MTKRFLSLLLIAGIFFSPGLHASATAETFSDVQGGSWYYDNVSTMVSMDAISGYPDGSFRPNGDITNGEFLSMLMKTLSDISFPDTGSHWASGVLSAAIDSKVCSVDDLGENALNTPITRAEAAKYTANATMHLLHEESVDTEGIDKLIHDITDVQASGCEAEIIDMYARGIITGDNLHNFNPDANIKRCEAVTIVMRAYNQEARTLPFGVEESIETVWSDYGVFFISLHGSRYDVKSVSVASLSANGIPLEVDFFCGEEAYLGYISSKDGAKALYEDHPAPDMVATFDWIYNDIEALATENYYEADGSAHPIITFEFDLLLHLTDGSVVPYSFSPSYYVDTFGGVL